MDKMQYVYLLLCFGIFICSYIIRKLFMNKYIKSIDILSEIYKSDKHYHSNDEIKKLRAEINNMPQLSNKKLQIKLSDLKKVISKS